MRFHGHVAPYMTGVLVRRLRMTVAGSTVAGWVAAADLHLTREPGKRSSGIWKRWRSSNLLAQAGDQLRTCDAVPARSFELMQVSPPQPKPLRTQEP
jgi:hypothetical protein